MKKSRITTALLAIGISASMVFQTPVFATEETAAAASSGITTNGISGWPQGPEITSASAVIMEDTSDTLLYAKDMDTTLSPAGAVKIMTCLLALENSQLDDQVTDDRNRCIRCYRRRRSYFLTAWRGIYHGTVPLRSDAGLCQ